MQEPITRKKIKTRQMGLHERCMEGDFEEEEEEGEEVAAAAIWRELSLD